MGMADGWRGVARVCARSLSRYKCGLVPGSECFLNSPHLLLLPHIPGAMLDSNLATGTGEARPLLPWFERPPDQHQPPHIPARDKR